MMPFLSASRDVELLVLIAVQSTIVSALALTAARLFRQNAAIRHAVLLTAVVAVIVGPLVTLAFEASDTTLVSIRFAAPALPEEVSPEASREVIIPEEAIAEIIAEAGLIVPHAPETDALADDAPIALTATDSDETPQAIENIGHADASPNWASRFFIMVCSLWLGGVLLLGAGFIRSGLRVRRIVRESRPLDGSLDDGMLAEIRRGLNVEQLPVVAESETVAGPMAAGLLHARVLVPAGFVEAVSRYELRDVLLHEVAHVLRRDHLVVLLQNAARIVFWWQPLIILLNRELARAREEVCDNYVLSVSEPVDYGDVLLRLACGPSNSTTLPATLGLFHSHWPLEHRIRGLLDDRRRIMTRVHRRVSLAVLIGFASITLSVSGSRVTAQNADPVKADSVPSPQPEDVAAVPEKPEAPPQPSAKQPPSADKAEKKRRPTVYRPVTVGDRVQFVTQQVPVEYQRYVTAFQAAQQKPEKAAGDVDARIRRLERLVEQLLAEKKKNETPKPVGDRAQFEKVLQQYLLSVKLLQDADRKKAAEKAAAAEHEQLQKAVAQQQNAQINALRAQIRQKQDALAKLRTEIHTLEETLKKLTPEVPGKPPKKDESDPFSTP